jgi:hypothetical protein
MEQVIYSTQLALYYGIPKKAALSMLQQMQRRIQEALDNGVSLKDISEYKKFQKLLGKVNVHAPTPRFLYGTESCVWGAGS